MSTPMLIVEDDPQAAGALATLLGARGYEPLVATTLARARKELGEGGNEVELVFLDLGLPDGDGMDLLAELSDAPGSRAVVVLTGERSLERAVEAMRLGAIDFISKPLTGEHLTATLTRVERYLADSREQRRLRSELAARGAYEGLVGRSDAMRAVYELVEAAAPSRIPVFIRGESGTGKELLARAIHRVSRRREGPFVALNCGAVPANLAESELFGHERGAFTGAMARHAGVFERADGGTLFLDELGEMPPDLQVRLLRVLEEGVVRPVGGRRDFPVDVRVVSATNRSPERQVSEGSLREDLFYRLHVFPIDVPPLRERPDDVPLLVSHFVQLACEEAECPPLEVTSAVLTAARAYDWPGNVRELRNVVSRAVLLAGDGPLDVRHRPLEVAGGARSPEPAASETGGESTDFRVPFGASLADAERILVEGYLEHYGGHREATARALGVTPKTLYNRCKAYGINPPNNTRRSRQGRD